MSHRITVAFTLIVLLLVAVSACAPAPTPATPTMARVATVVLPTAMIPPATPASLTITDVAGRTVTLAAIPQRIISLAPSNTEILFALGLSAQVVAVILNRVGSETHARWAYVHLHLLAHPEQATRFVVAA